MADVQEAAQVWLLRILLKRRKFGVQVPVAEAQSQQWMEAHASRFQSALTAAGWDVDTASLVQSDRTAAWGVHMHAHDE